MPASAVRLILILLAAALLAGATTPGPDPAAAARKGTELAEGGQCAEALPLLVKSVRRLAGKDLKRAAEFAGVRCAMALNRTDEAQDFIRGLLHEYPRDPEVLYLATHVYSDLSIRSSEQLLFSAPSSYQVHELNAEALETQGKWKEAESEYRVVLEQNPNLPGIHFRLGRLILSQPKTATTFDDAKREFEAELKINPSSAGAEYVLGEIARQAEQWPAAIEHFRRATKLDASFADAFIGLGRSLMSQGKIAESIPPLEAAGKLQPANPVPHYYLAVAYRRTGRRQDSDRETAAHKEMSERARQRKQEIQLGVLGPQRVDPSEPAQ